MLEHSSVRLFSVAGGQLLQSGILCVSSFFQSFCCTEILNIPISEIETTCSLHDAIGHACGKLVTISHYYSSEWIPPVPTKTHLSVIELSNFIYLCHTLLYPAHIDQHFQLRAYSAYEISILKTESKALVLSHLLSKFRFQPIFTYLLSASSQQWNG